MPFYKHTSLRASALCTGGSLGCWDLLKHLEKYSLFHRMLWGHLSTWAYSRQSEASRGGWDLLKHLEKYSLNIFSFHSSVDAMSLLWESTDIDIFCLCGYFIDFQNCLLLCGWVSRGNISCDYAAMLLPCLPFSYTYLSKWWGFSDLL